MSRAMRHRLVYRMLIASLIGGAVPLHAFERSAVEKSVVRVINKSEGGTGSGTVLNANGDVLTNHHVTSGSRSLFVVSEFSGGEQPAEIMWESSEKDLAVIRAPSLGLPSAPLFSGQLEDSPPVYALGYPGASDLGSLALDATLTDGLIGRIFPSRRPEWNVTIVQHNAEINPGNSGGPLFDNCGRVIGVNTAGPSETGTRGINWASHIKEAMDILRTKSIEFLSDGSPCVSATSGAGVDEQAREKAEEAVQSVKAIEDTVEEVAKGTTQAVEAIEDTVENVKEVSRITNMLIALVAVVTFVALGLALRKPRQEILRVAGQMAAPLSRLVQSVRRKKPDIALTGFDAQGRPVTLMLGRADLDRQQGGFTVGRHPLLVDHVLDGERLSKRHARFSDSHGSVFVEDLNSGNGTSVNGVACPPFQPIQIRPGDMVDVGGIALRVSA